MSTTVSQPSLTLDADAHQPASGGVGVCNLGPHFMASLDKYLQAGGRLQSIFRVNVIRTGAPITDDLPNVFGRMTFWMAAFNSDRTFHSSREFHIEQASTLGRCVVPDF